MVIGKDCGYGVYHGYWQELEGERAIVRHTDDYAVVEAQFDNVNLHHPKLPEVKLGFGWHRFPAQDFEIWWCHNDNLDEGEFDEKEKST